MDTETLISKLLPYVTAQRAEIAHKHCKTDADQIALATVYAMQAYEIWKALDGEKMAAAQFYVWADRCAAPSPK